MKSVAQVLYRRLRASSALAPAFSPASLFAAGEQGVWYDNSSYLTTMFQDAAGTTPVTGLEQPVGLRLDKSKGLTLGSELVTNGDFSNGTTGWTGYPSGTVSATISVVDGRGRVTNTASAEGRAYQTFTGLTVGRVYLITCDAYVGTASVSIGWTSNSNTTGGDAVGAASSGKLTLRAQATATTMYLRIVANTAGLGRYAEFDNISVRELPGNHASQSTAASRPVLSARVNLLRYTEQFDNSVWVKAQTTSTAPVVTANQATAPDGTLTADKIDFGVIDDAGDYSVVQQSLTPTETLSYTGSVYVKAATSGDIGKKIWVYCFDTAVKGLQSVVLSDSFQRVVISPTITTGSNRWFAIGTIGSTYGGENQGVVSALVWGADLRVSNESSALPAYQRVGAAVNGTSTSIGTPDYDTTGFPVYLRYDGGDWYQTSSIDFSTGATNPPTTGAELVTNGTFDANITGWTQTNPSTATASWSSGQLRLDYITGYGGATAPVVLVGGKTYRISARLTCIGQPNLAARAQLFSVPTPADYSLGALATSSFVLPSNPTEVSINYTATSNGTFYVGVGVRGTPASGDYILADNVSVKEVEPLYAPNRMSVFAGVRKLSDAAAEMFVELSASAFSNSGTFFASNYSPLNGSLGGRYSFLSRGTTYPLTAPTTLGYSAPLTNIITGLGDISGDSAILRINGQQIIADSGDQGTGNFGNYPLYIGSRGGTSIFFTGRDYGLIIVGRAVTAAELANTENYMETQTFGKDMQFIYSDELTTALGDPITAADGDPIYMSVTYA